MFDIMLYAGLGFILLLIVFCGGYLIACRENGKDVKFWKDVVSRQNATIAAQLQEIERMQRCI